MYRIFRRECTVFSGENIPYCSRENVFSIGMYHRISRRWYSVFSGGNILYYPWRELGVFPGEYTVFSGRNIPYFLYKHVIWIFLLVYLLNLREFILSLFNKSEGEKKIELYSQSKIFPKKCSFSRHFDELKYATFRTMAKIK